MSQTESDLARRLENLLCLGTIAEVDHSHARVKLDIAGRTTGWLPYSAEIGANFRRWRPLRVGTQVLAGCPSGDPANAVIVQILYTDALPSPSTRGDLDIVQFDDGTVVSYDSGAKLLTAETPGDLAVTAGGNITADAGGNVSAHAGTDITATADGNVSIEAAASARIAGASLELVTTQGGAGAATMTGSFRLVGDFEITGTVEVTGGIHASGDILADGSNSNHHSH